MVTETQLLRKAFKMKQRKSANTIISGYNIKKVDKEKRIVTGEVYAPDVIDAHGDAMDAAEIEKLAHRFLMESLNSHIDIMHDNQPALAVAVESFIAREGDNLYTPGSWVLSVKIQDEALWDEIKKGKYSGYSMEVLVNKETRIVRVQTMEHVFGLTQDNNGHNHAFYVKLSEDGKVLKGATSTDDGHSHDIRLSTATEFADDHTHRFFLP